MYNYKLWKIRKKIIKQWFYPVLTLDFNQKSLTILERKNLLVSIVHLTFWQNLETSVKLHKIKKLIVLNHQYCRAAKIINGKKKFSFNIEKKIHEKSFKLVKQKLKKKFPKIIVETKIMKLK